MEKEHEDLDNGLKKLSTKQKILDSAIHLFAIKGYTETTIRELAATVGVKEASIYNHFPSKIAILECILNEFAQISKEFFQRDKLAELVKNPTVDGILACIQISFPKDKEAYYLNQLCVILQEQHRNPIVRGFMSNGIILSTEQVMETIINKLKECNKLRPETDPDFWIKAHSSLVYTFASRMLLGIGDQAPNFSGKGLLDLLLDMYDMLFRIWGTQDSGAGLSKDTPATPHCPQ